MSAYNSEKTIKPCFDSIEKALKNHKWKMVFGDDGSKDKTFNIAIEYSEISSADSWVISSFPKAKNVAQSKNRILQLAKEHSEDYPAICFMDADDIMGEERVNKLLEALIKENGLFVHGDYIIDYKDKRKSRIESEKISDTLRFGIWSTLFHESLINKNVNFFREDLNRFSDILKWWELKHLEKINIIPVKGFITNYYQKENSSINNGDLKEDLKRLKIEKEKVLEICNKISFAENERYSREVFLG